MCKKLSLVHSDSLDLHLHSWWLCHHRALIINVEPHFFLWQWERRHLNRGNFQSHEMDIQVLWQAGDHLTAPGQCFPFPTANTQWQDFLATVPLAWRAQETHTAALLGQPAMVLCRAGAVQPGSLSPGKTWAWGETRITPVWGHASLLCLHALPRSGVVSKQFRHEARLGSNTTSRLKSHLDLPLGSSPLAAQVSPFPTPQILQTSLLRHQWWW